MQHKNAVVNNADVLFAQNRQIIASKQAESAIRKLDALFVKNRPAELVKSLVEECATPTTININAVAGALFHLNRESVLSALVKHFSMDAADNG